MNRMGFYNRVPLKGYSRVRNLERHPEMKGALPQLDGTLGGID